MASDFDWLVYLSLLSPKTSLSVGGRGGVPSVTREDVLGALSGVGLVPSLLVEAFTGEISLDFLVKKSGASAFVSALAINEDLLSRYSLDDFICVWNVTCHEFIHGIASCEDCHRGFGVGGNICGSCGGTGFAEMSTRGYASVARVSRDKWVRLSVIFPIAKSVLDCYLNMIRLSLSDNFSRGGEVKISSGVSNIDRVQNIYSAHSIFQGGV